MRIVLVNTTDSFGGAAKSAYRLHQALKKNGVDCLMVVQEKKSNDSSIHSLNGKVRKFLMKFKPTFDTLPIILFYKKTKSLFSSSIVCSANFVKLINGLNPDLVHIHWVCNGMLQIEDLKKINAPIVITMHDCWSFTGGCHYSWKCSRYLDHCGKCPVIQSKFEQDLSSLNWKRKKTVYSRINNLNFIGPSNWIAKSALESSLLKNYNVINIPNPIDTFLFKPTDKKVVRSIWGLPDDKKLIMFGAMGATSDIRKGFTELSQAINLLKSNEIELIIYGANEPLLSHNFKFKTHYLGYISDDVSLVCLYNAVDIVVVPSLEENLSNVIVESLSCSTPVVAFDIGGNSDIIDHCVNGYLAKPFDISDFAIGIDTILYSNRYESIREEARKKVLTKFDSNIVIDEFIKFYKNVINMKSC